MFFNFFKKDKKKKSVVQKTELIEETSPSASLSKTDHFLILKGLYVTEKSGHLSGFNQYVFKVVPRSNKLEIKKAVEKMYGVKVVRVTVSLAPSKKRKLGRQEGERAGFKKAIIKLAEGYKIDVASK